MDESLDQRIRSDNIPSLDMSLDEYIHFKKMGNPVNGVRASQREESSSVSKFDRYRKQDEEVDETMDDDVSDEMPKLVPYEMKTLPPKNTKPIHQRLGERGSICESIHTSQLKLFQSNKFKAKNRNSVQNRLGKAWVNPAVKERNRIALHTLKVVKDSPQSMIESDKDTTILLKAFAKAINRDHLAPNQSSEQKYNIKLQKEISMMQGKPLSYLCPGGFVVSSDGPGIRGQFKVPSHATEMSLNHRFA